MDNTRFILNQRVHKACLRPNRIWCGCSRRWKFLFGLHGDGSPILGDFPSLAFPDTSPSRDTPSLLRRSTRCACARRILLYWYSREPGSGNNWNEQGRIHCLASGHRSQHWLRTDTWVETLKKNWAPFYCLACNCLACNVQDTSLRRRWCRSVPADPSFSK